MWSFTLLPGGGTHVSNTEAFAGLPLALLRPLVARRWNRLFQAAVDGLVRTATAGQRERLSRLKALRPPIRARASLDRHATYIVAAFIAGAAREHTSGGRSAPAPRTDVSGRTSEQGRCGRKPLQLAGECPLDQGTVVVYQAGQRPQVNDRAVSGRDKVDDLADRSGVLVTGHD